MRSDGRVDEFERGDLALADEFGLGEPVEPREIGRGERQPRRGAEKPSVIALAAVDCRKERRE